jgi:hypothetical protein
VDSLHQVLQSIELFVQVSKGKYQANRSSEHDKVKEDRFWPYFKGAIGAIDGSHVRVSVPTEEVVNHTCRHGNTT